MGVMEVVLILLGIVVVVVSFLIPAGKKEDGEYHAGLSEDAVREMVEKEAGNVKATVSDMVDETVTYAIEKSERAMERLTNEKIMAVNEYSDTVLEEINKNHKEVVFLYDMLNDKHETLMSTVSEAIKKESEIKQTLTDAEVTAKEAETKAKDIQNALVRAVENTRKALQEAASVDREAAVSAPAPEAAAKEPREEKQTDGFKPINAKKLEVIKQQEEAPEEKEAAKGSTKGRRKKSTRAALKDILPESVIPEAVQVLEQEEPAMIPEAEAKDEENPDTRNNNERILELHQAGKSDITIAKELGLGIGEVKLVIDLYEGNEGTQKK